MTKQDEILGYRGASKLLGISVRSLRLWRVAGAMPPGRLLGRRRVWSREELVAWDAAGRPPAAVWSAYRLARKEAVA